MASSVPAARHRWKPAETPIGCARSAAGGDQQSLAGRRKRRANPVLAAAQTLELYRDVCRRIDGEQMYDAGNGTRPN